jgi:large repetitive protein
MNWGVKKGWGLLLLSLVLFGFSLTSVLGNDDYNLRVYDVYHDSVTAQYGIVTGFLFDQSDRLLIFKHDIPGTTNNLKTYVFYIDKKDWNSGEYKRVGTESITQIESIPYIAAFYNYNDGYYRIVLEKKANPSVSTAPCFFTLNTVGAPNVTADEYTVNSQYHPAISWSWTQPAGPPVHIRKYNIYTKFNNGKLFLTASVNGSTTTYQTQAKDFRNGDGRYQFYLTAVADGGPIRDNQSLLSTNCVTVNLDNIAPAAITDLSGPTYSKTAGVQLTWSAPTDSGSGVKNYQLYYGLHSDGTKQMTTFEQSANNSYSLTLPVDKEGSYDLYLYAVDYAGNRSSQSNPVTIIYDKTSPDPPTNLTSEFTATNINLRWTAPKAADLDYYNLYIYKSDSLIYLSVIKVTGATAYSLSKNSFKTGKYHIVVTAVDKAGNESNKSGGVDYDTAFPQAPVINSGEIYTNGSNLPEISWNALSGILHYVIYRSKDGGISYTQIATVQDDHLGLRFSYQTKSEDYDKTDGKYQFYVTAVSMDYNESGKSAGLTVYYDTTPPAAPIVTENTVSVNKATTDFPRINWSSSTDTLSGIKQYTIYKETVGSGLSYIGSVQPGVNLSYQTKVEQYSMDGTYKFYVKAADNAGNESTLSTEYVTVNCDRIVPDSVKNFKVNNSIGTVYTGDNKIQLSWDAVTDSGSGIKNYEVYNGTYLTEGHTLLASYDSSAGGQTLTLKTTGNYSAYNLYIYAVDNAGNRSADSEVVAVIWDGTPPVIESFGVVKSPTKDDPVLNWDATDQTTLTYAIQEGTNQLATGITGNTYTVTGLNEGTYTFTLIATDEAGNSTTSEQISVVIDKSVATPELSINMENPAAPKLSWTEISDETGNITYEVWEDNSMLEDSIKGTSYGLTGLNDGSYNFKVYAVDGLRNVSNASNSVTIVVDKTKPTINSFGVNKSPTKDDPVLTWDVTDNLTDKAGLDFLLRDGTNEYAVKGQTTYTVTGLSEGTHTFTLVATDEVGNSSTAASISVIVDKSVATPELSINTEIPASPKLSWTAISDEAGNVSYEVWVNNSKVEDNIQDTSHSLTGLSDGSYNFTVYAVDGLGNRSEASNIVTTTIDMAGPFISFAKPINNTIVDINSGSMIVVQLSDSLSGVNLNSVQISVDGSDVATSSIKKTGNTIYYFLQNPLSGTDNHDGTFTHKVIVTASDQLGNQSSDTLTFTVKNYRKGFGFGRFQF